MRIIFTARHTFALKYLPSYLAQSLEILVASSDTLGRIKIARGHIV